MIVALRSKKAFTLIELLVVIAIIALLVAMSVPRLGRMMEEGRRTQCRAQLRSLGVAMMLYAGENNGWLPARQQLPVSPRQGEYVFDGTPGFTYHVLKLFEAGHMVDPGTWHCPSDKWNGDGDDIRVFASTSFASPPFNSWENVSYMYVAGHNIASTREGPSVAPVLADESNSREDGTISPGAMPQLGDKAAHGANYRNVLYLDGSVVALDSADSANAIFDYLQNPSYLQSVD